MKLFPPSANYAKATILDWIMLASCLGLVYLIGRAMVYGPFGG